MRAAVAMMWPRNTIALVRARRAGDDRSAGHFARLAAIGE